MPRKGLRSEQKHSHRRLQTLRRFRLKGKARRAQRNEKFPTRRKTNKQKCVARSSRRMIYGFRVFKSRGCNTSRKTLSLHKLTSPRNYRGVSQWLQLRQHKPTLNSAVKVILRTFTAFPSAGSYSRAAATASERATRKNISTFDFRRIFRGASSCARRMRRRRDFNETFYEPVREKNGSVAPWTSSTRFRNLCCWLFMIYLQSCEWHFKVFEHLRLSDWNFL